MSNIIISPLVETWRIANLTNFDFGLPDVPGLTASNALPKKVNGVPQWFDALDFTTSEILAASVNFRNGLTTSPPSIGSEGYKHTHEGSYDVISAGGSLPDATDWHSHSGLDILTGGTTSNADSLHTHSGFTTQEDVDTSISNAIGDIDLSIYVTKAGSITQLSDITSDGATIEAAITLAHAQDHTLLEHLDDDPVTVANLTKLMDGSNADCCHTHSNLGGGSFDGEHNDLDGLNDGDYIHLTAVEKGDFTTLTDGSNADALHTHDGGGVSIHNDLDGLQGGDVGEDEFYHLDYVQYIGLVGGPSFFADDLHSHEFAATITVQDEGIDICTNVTTINFKGATVQAKDCVDGVVNVYVPPPAYVAHFNTDDGDVGGSAVVGNKSTTSRYVAGPTSEGTPYNIGDWSDGTIHNTVRSSLAAHTYTTTNACSFKNDSTTTIEVNVYDADGVAKLATKTTTAITGAYDNTSDNIRVQVTSWATNEDQYQGIVTVTFNIDTILGNISGRYGVEIIHHNSTDGNFTYTQTSLFYDNESNTQTIGNVTIAENTPVIMRKSGVYYYDTGSTFTVNIDDLDWLNSESYPTTLVVMTGTEYGLPGINVGSGSLTSWTSKYNIMNVTYNNTAWAVNQSNYFTRTTTGNVTGRVQDWSAGASDSSPNAAVIIDTYNDNSTRVYEDFRGEDERLKADLATSWDSTQDITSYDSGTGLQQGEGTKLFYPKSLDYGTYEPNSVFQPDYTGETGDKFYYRGMWHTSTEHSNGNFSISGVTEQNITDDDIIIEISLDGSAWYNCNESYTFGALVNGDGCRVNPGTQMPNLNFTLGEGGSTGSGTGPGWGIWLRLTMPDTSTVEMGIIQITNWT
jgi:hypothetical protein